MPKAKRDSKRRFAKKALQPPKLTKVSYKVGQAAPKTVPKAVPNELLTPFMFPTGARTLKTAGKKLVQKSYV